MREAKQAQDRPPSSWPAKSAFFLPRVTGRLLGLDRIGVHFDPAVLDEEGEAGPMIEPIGDGAPEIGLRGDPRPLPA